MDIEEQRELENLKEKGKICGAKKSSGGLCKGKPMENGRCLVHGGKVPKGVQHHATQTGKYSKYIPENLQNRHEEFLKSKDIMTLSDEIAVIESRIAQLLERANDSQAGLYIDELVRRFNRLDTVRGTDGEQAAWINLEQLVQKAENDMYLWDEMAKQMDLKRKMVDTERRKMSDLNQYITVDRAMLMFQGLSNIVNRHIQRRKDVFMDEKQIAELIQDIGEDFKSMIDR